MFKITHTIIGLFLVSQGAIANAALTVSITPSASEYQEGDVGHLDVRVSSDSNDEVDSFLFDIEISGGDGVSFVSPQDESFLKDRDYVFFERSLNDNLGLSATLVSGAGTILTMTDVSYDPASGDPLPALIPEAGSELLLGRFAFQAVGTGTYDVGLNVTDSSFSDVNFNTLSFDATGASFNVTAVPEPSSLVALISAGACIAYRRRRLA